MVVLVVWMYLLRSGIFIYGGLFYIYFRCGDVAFLSFFLSFFLSLLMILLLGFNVLRYMHRMRKKSEMDGFTIRSKLPSL